VLLICIVDCTKKEERRKKKEERRKKKGAEEEREEEGSTKKQEAMISRVALTHTRHTDRDKCTTRTAYPVRDKE